MTEEKKRGRKYNYILMLFADSKKGNIRQIRIESVVVETFFAVVFLMMIVLAVLSHKRGQELILLQKTSAAQKEQLQLLGKEKAELTIREQELADKVVVLSNTINRKLDEEEAEAEREARKRMPIGFPMTTSASVEQIDSEEPMVKLTGDEMGSIVAAGVGVVDSITSDSGYLHCIRIDHDNGYISVYRNDGEVMVREGDEVVRGSILYVIGEDNAELGYQILYDGKHVDPMELLNIDG